ncbi:MAG TPA: dihydrolipoamide acetyltransferase family protein [Thermoleophilaceae bacterium]
MSEFRMPSLGADMDSGVLLEWRVQPGDRVKRGDIVAVVDTKKAEIEIEVFEDGLVGALLVPVGERVPVGTVIATIETAETPRPPPEPGGPPQPPEPGVPPPPEPTRPAGNGRIPTAVAVGQAVPEHRRRISPLARRVAADLGVNLEAVTGTGPRGAVTQADVERAAGGAQVGEPPAPAEPAATATPTEERARAMRQAIAELMVRSKREIPHYYLGLDIDMGPALAWLDEHNAAIPLAERVLPAALLARAAAVAAREVPALNGFWVDGGFHPSEPVHLGFAVSLRGGGLIAPAIHDADRKTPDELMRDIRDLVRRTRSGGLRASEMADPTITVTNLGERGTDATYGVIYPPQVALVGFGRIREQPVARDGMLGVGPVVTATLSADHRASDGHAGALFLAAIEAVLQRPEEL